MALTKQSIADAYNTIFDTNFQFHEVPREFVWVASANSLGSAATIGDVSVTFPDIQKVSVTNFPAFAFDADGNLKISGITGGTTSSNSGIVTIADRINPNLKLAINDLGQVGISNFPAIQQIAASALPLPTGAAREDTLINLLTRLPSALLNDRLKVDVQFPASQSVTGSVVVTNFPTTQAISVASLPLPADAAKDSTLFQALGKPNDPAVYSDSGTGGLIGFVKGLMGHVIAIVQRLPTTLVNDRFKVDVQFPTSQQISGSVNINNQPPFVFDESGNLRVSGTSGGTTSGTSVPNTEYAEGSTPSTAVGIAALGRNASNQLRPLALNNSNQALVSVSNFPATQQISGTLNVGNFPTVQPVSGTVAISNQPALAFDANGNLKVSSPNTQSVTGTVSVSNFPTTQQVSGSVGITNFPATQTITGAVSVSNFPANQAISGSVAVNNQPPFVFDANGNLRVNFPAVQPVSGSLSISNQPAFTFDANGNLKVSNPVSQAVTGTVSVSNFPATQPVSGSVGINNFPATQAVSGNVGINNFPATQTVAGSVAVSNFPANQPISGSVAVSNQPNFAFDANGNLKISSPTSQAVTGTVSVANFPATQPVSGNVGINNFPATQAVSGSVAVSNFPAIQGVSAEVLPLPTGASRQIDVEGIRDRLPISVGSKPASASFPVTLASDGVLATSVGTKADPAPNTDTEDSSIIGFFKRLQTKISFLTNLFPQTLAASGGFRVDGSAVTQPITGNVNARLFDSAGNGISTNLANTRRSLDVAVNVGGTLVDPRMAVAPINIRRQGISLSTSGDNPVITGVAGQRIKILGLFLIVNGDVSVILKSGTSNLTGIMPLASKGNGFVLPQAIVGYHWLEGGVGESFVINLSAGIITSGVVLFVQEA
jgi:hypothetical protein